MSNQNGGQFWNTPQAYNNNGFTFWNGYGNPSPSQTDMSSHGGQTQWDSEEETGFSNPEETLDQKRHKILMNGLANQTAGLDLDGNQAQVPQGQPQAPQAAQGNTKADLNMS
ncbi:hypothetical protein FRC02_005831 [Tulasnella sp. 418]|nr:hypothetical protein FRC02_005831 [Tulasnella sp. 418]